MLKIKKVSPGKKIEVVETDVGFSIGYKDKDFNVISMIKSHVVLPQVWTNNYGVGYIDHDDIMWYSGVLNVGQEVDLEGKSSEKEIVFAPVCQKAISGVVTKKYVLGLVDGCVVDAVKHHLGYTYNFHSLFWLAKADRIIQLHTPDEKSDLESFLLLDSEGGNYRIFSDDGYMETIDKETAEGMFEDTLTGFFKDNGFQQES